MLTELQRRVARLMSGLVEAESFALAGGAALVVHGIVERATRDLDYFATASEEVARVLPNLEVTLRHDGLAVVRRRDAPGFVRLEVTDEKGEAVEVDLAYDARLLPAQASDFGSVLHPDEVAADKVLALYGRAEARDFHDVAALARRYPTERLLELAASKDRGFDQRRFTEMLSAIGRLRNADFPDPDRAEELRSWFEQWKQELISGL
jgi:predicted nucleotidyltransferase component of viral defense system